MERALASRLVEDWDRLHVTAAPPAPDALAAVTEMLATLPEPEAAAAVTGPDDRPRIAALAGGALYLLWAVPGSAAAPGAARCRRIPLQPGTIAVELSERRGGGRILRHWSFELDEEPLVLRTSGDDDAERFARALARALGWPQ